MVKHVVSLGVSTSLFISANVALVHTLGLHVVYVATV